MPFTIEQDYEKSLIFFMPLFFSPNPWVGEAPDKNVVSMSVKIVAVPVMDGLIDVKLADVFSVTGDMPPYPRNGMKNQLLATIWDAVGARTGKDVMPLTWDVVIYGGK